MCLLTPPGNPSPLCTTTTCKVCQGPKPNRAHHCSICKKCILKMDHHCPWIHSCVGHFNHRYFLLFLLYLEIGCAFFVVVSFPTMKIKPKKAVQHLSFVLCAVFCLVMAGFGGWHWFLALKGHTTIEFFSMIGAKEKEKEKYNFSRGSWRKNLEVVFGTQSLIWALMPRREKLQFNGVVWPDTLHAL